MKELNELIIIKQLPIIEEQLKSLSDEIDKKVDVATNLVCNNDTVKEVKKVRSELNNTFKELEAKRKEVKEKIMTPYDKFNESYKKYISDKFNNADVILKGKIDDVESELKSEKKQEIKEYFNELIAKEKIDFIDFEQIGINVTLSASIKSLKEEVESFIYMVIGDLKLIDTQEYKEEILIEYKKNLKAPEAITEVVNRHKQLEEIEKQKESEKEQKITDEEMIQKIDSLSSPKIEEKETLVTATFKATCSEEKMKKLVKFMKEEGIKYEQCK